MRDRRERYARITNHQWQKRRRVWADYLIETGGVPCSRCGQPVTASMEWHLDHHLDDHDDDHVWPAHASCNSQAGGRLSHATRTGGAVGSAMGDVGSSQPIAVGEW